MKNLSFRILSQVGYLGYTPQNIILKAVDIMAFLLIEKVQRNLSCYEMLTLSDIKCLSKMLPSNYQMAVAVWSSPNIKTCNVFTVNYGLLMVNRIMTLLIPPYGHDFYSLQKEKSHLTDKHLKITSWLSSTYQKSSKIKMTRITLVMVFFQVYQE